MAGKILTRLFIVFLACASVSAQTESQTDTWKPLRYFIGTWEGQGIGKPGESKLEREYSFTLGNKFLRASHRSIYPVQEKNPKGEIHEDLGFLSYDKRRKQFIFRQFHVEGFVIHYVLSSVSADGKTLVFDSEQIENIGPGWRARETWRITGENEFAETFELSAAGKEFETYVENRFRRKKN
jgi:hypothetical protein